jgi:hypothetical protein
MVASATLVQVEMGLSSSSVLSAGLCLATDGTTHAQIILAYLGTVFDMVHQTGACPKQTQANWAMCVTIDIQPQNIFNTMLSEHVQTELLEGPETRITHITLVAASRGRHLGNWIPAVIDVGILATSKLGDTLFEKLGSLKDALDPASHVEPNTLSEGF